MLFQPRSQLYRISSSPTGVQPGPTQIWPSAHLDAQDRADSGASDPRLVFPRSPSPDSPKEPS